MRVKRLIWQWASDLKTIITWFIIWFRLVNQYLASIELKSKILLMVMRSVEEIIFLHKSHCIIRKHFLIGISYYRFARLYWLRRVFVTEQNDNSGLSPWSLPLLLVVATVVVAGFPLIVYVAMHEGDVCWLGAAFNLLLRGE